MITKHSLAFLLAMAPWLAACEPTPPIGDAARFEADVRATIPELLDPASSPGAAVALVGVNGVLWSGGFGTTEPGGGQPVDADTLFSIQSMTKSFTSTAVEIAVEDGLVDLDRPVSELLPDFRVQTFFAARPEERMTLRHLLSHRAGFTHMPPVGNVYDDTLPSFEAHVASISQTWLRRPVGSRTAYSNAGFDLAGWILQSASGQPFEAFVRAHILEPLGMTRSSFDHAVIHADPNHARGFEPGFHGAVPDTPLLASGGLWSSANELARFVQFQLGRGTAGGVRLLPGERWRELHTIPAPVSEHQKAGMALGVAIIRQQDGRVLAAGHAGGGYGFSSAMYWLPEVGLGYVLLTNSRAQTALRGEVDRAFASLLRTEERQPFVADWRDEPAPVECRTADRLHEDRHRGIYIGRTATLEIVRKDGVFGVRSSEFVPLCFVEDEIATHTVRGHADSYRLKLGPTGLPTRITGLNSGAVYEYDHGPNDPPGPAREHWIPLLGAYTQLWYGQIESRFELEGVNGYLHFAGQRLVAEPEPRLFVSSLGEVLDLRETPAAGHPTWRSARLRRVDSGNPSATPGP